MHSDQVNIAKEHPIRCHIEWQRHGAWAKLFDCANHSLGFGLVFAVSENRTYPATGQMQNSVFAEAAVAASHKSDFVIHQRLFLLVASQLFKNCYLLLIDWNR